MTIFNSKNDEVSQTFQRRNKKINQNKNSILIKELIQFLNEKDLLITFIDSEIEINFINQTYII